MLQTPQCHDINLGRVECYTRQKGDMLGKVGGWAGLDRRSEYHECLEMRDELCRDDDEMGSQDEEKTLPDMLEGHVFEQ